MKFKTLISLTLAAIVAVLFTGCRTQTKQVLVKQTIFGFQATTPQVSGAALCVQVGLIRSEYFSNPTSTNAVYAAPFASKVDANMTALRQTATEELNTK